MAGFNVKLFRDDGYEAQNESGEIQLSPAPGPATIKFYETNAPNAGWDFLVEGSHDKLNWVTINASVSAESAMELASPWPFVKVTQTAAWGGGAGEVMVSICWVYD